MGGPLPVLFTLSGLASLGHLSQREGQVGVRERQGGCAAFAAGPCLALPLGELAPEAAERAGGASAARTLSVFAALRHLSQRERQEWVRERQVGLVRGGGGTAGHKKETPEGVSLFAGVSGRKSQISEHQERCRRA